MRSKIAWAKVSGCIVVVFAMLFPCSPVAAQETGKLELWFEYDSHAVKLSVAPTVRCLSQKSMRDVGCELYRGEDGRYWITQPAPGKYLLRVSADENRENGPMQPGDLYRELPFRIDESTTGPLLVSLQRLMALQRPVDSRQAISELSESCDNKPHYSTAFFSLSSAADIEFAWEPYEKDIQYHYKLWSVRCSDDARIARLFLRKAHDTNVRITAPANEPGEYYRFEATAMRNGQAVGQLILSDGRGAYLDAYAFAVIDPLGDRSWLLYLIALGLLLLVLWGGISLLRGTARLPAEETGHRRGRWIWWVLLLLSVGVAGYLQRQVLVAWLQKGEEQATASLKLLQKWYQGMGAETVPAVLRYGTGTDIVQVPMGMWQGVIVSASSEPFIGDGRRAELRISFDEQGGQVQWLDAGQWVTLGNKVFTARPSGSGLTMFGHWRRGGKSELWTINIPDIHGNSAQVTLDRMLSRRDASGSVTSSVRYQANGELHYLFP